MQSAFGIDHGEITKGFVRGRIVNPARSMRGFGGRRPTRAQKKYKPNPGGTGPQKIKGALNRVGEADISLKGIGSTAGKATRATGSFLENRPGLTGTALVGGGGAAGYKFLSEKQPKKKKR